MLFDNIALTLGSAVRSFEKARSGEAGHGPARRPLFLSNTAQEARWKGGTYLPEQDAAALRAMQNSWVYMIIQRKAMEKSAARMYIVDNPSGLPDTGDVVPNHDLLRILRNPNPHMDGQFLSMYMDWWLDLLGNTYLFIALDEFGMPAELWPLPANRVNVVPGDNKRFVDYYEYSANGAIFNIPAEYVYHEMYPNPYDMYRGLAPLVAGMLPADADSAMAWWNGSFFGSQNVMPSAVISLGTGDPNTQIDPADVEALKTELTNDYAAINRKTAVVGAYKMDVAILGWNAKDMDFLAGRAATKDEIIQIFGGLPGMFDKNATEANATVADNMFKEKTIWPLLGLRAARITNHILRRYYGKSHEARYVDIRPVNRQADATDSQASADVMFIDERRKRFWRMDALPNGAGQKFSSEVAGAGMAADPFAIPGANALQSNPALPNPQNAVVPSARSLGEDLKAWRWRSLKSLKDGRTLTLEFKSAVISDEIRGAVLSGLDAAQDEADIKAVFTLAGESALKGIIRSWRPWSSFELRLMAEVTQILSDQAADIGDRVRAAGTVDPLYDPITWMAQEQMMRERIEPLFAQLAVFGAQRVRKTVEAIGDSSTAINWDLANDKATAWARQHAGEMVSNVTKTTRDAVAEQVAQWSQTGEGIDGLTKRIADMRKDDGKPVFGQVRAEMIAVSESTNVYAGANSEAWAAAGYARAVYKPGAHVKCILPGNKVFAPGKILAAAKSFYSGRAIEITVSGGSRLTVTENHPIFTSQGWVAAKFINKGDDVFCASNSEGMTSDYPNNHNGVAKIEEIFSAFKESDSVASASVPVSPENFYGDGRSIHGDIEIVYTNSLLISNANAEINQPFSENNFALGLMRPGALPSDGESPLALDGNGLPEHSFVGAGEKTGALSLGGVLPPAEHGVGNAARLDAGSQQTLPERLAINSSLDSESLFGLTGDVSIDKDLGDRAPLLADAALIEPGFAQESGEVSRTDISLASQFVKTFSGAVALEKVIQIREFEFSGHVYDLQVEPYELYLCGGVVVSNCRCYIQPYKMDDGSKALRWLTARDERVCQEPLTTPWGEVKGCKDLHKRIISEGKHLGEKTE